MSNDQTTVVKKEVSQEELNELLGTGPGAESVMTQEDKPSFFSSRGMDMSFIDKKAKPEPKIEEQKAEEVKATAAEAKAAEDKLKSTGELQSILDEVDPIEADNPDKQTDKTKGRPSIAKDAAIEVTKKLIEKGVLVPFDDDKKFEDYTTADFEELFEANIKNREEEIRTKTPIEFFDSLPEEMRYAAKYIADGGTDLRGLFRALSEVEETKALSEDVPEDQETIVREYLSVTGFGTQEDIEEEINSWKDLGKLATNAEKFKPRLEKMRSEQIATKLAEQESLRKQRVAAAQNYQNSIYKVLEPGEVNGIKYDKKVQGALYTGLTQSQYPSISGKATNLLGHLLEKYQFVEPNHALITEITWHLMDPEGFKNKVKELGKTDATETIVRKLKTEEQKKIASSSTSEKEDEPRQKKLQRTGNFFKR